ncbi:MAG: hypothetical protein K0Q87_4327, partial [Neobacillus sp.]|nr:hypothetical protein [Neobacillus sp.]
KKIDCELSYPDDEFSKSVIENLLQSGDKVAYGEFVGAEKIISNFKQTGFPYNAAAYSKQQKMNSEKQTSMFVNKKKLVSNSYRYSRFNIIKGLMRIDILLFIIGTLGLYTSPLSAIVSWAILAGGLLILILTAILVAINLFYKLFPDKLRVCNDENW